MTPAINPTNTRPPNIVLYNVEVEDMYDNVAEDASVGWIGSPFHEVIWLSESSLTVSLAATVGLVGGAVAMLNSSESDCIETKFYYFYSRFHEEGQRKK